MYNERKRNLFSYLSSSFSFVFSCRSLRQWTTNPNSSCFVDIFFYFKLIATPSTTPNKIAIGNTTATDVLRELVEVLLGLDELRPIIPIILSLIKTI